MNLIHGASCISTKMVLRATDNAARKNHAKSSNVRMKPSIMKKLKNLNMARKDRDCAHTIFVTFMDWMMMMKN